MFWLIPSRFQLWPDTGNPRGRASPGHRADSAPLHRPYGRDRWCPKLLQTRSCTSPANQVIIGLSLFLTYFIMEPVWSKVQTNALQPYMEKKITSAQAVDEASKPIRAFMLRQTRPRDVELFVELAKIPATVPDAMPLRVVIPAFIISELRTAFQMGFLIFVPFILIDIVVATILMSMGMMMMPPATIALPLKILLFVLVDGWSLIVRSLLMSFGV